MGLLAAGFGSDGLRQAMPSTTNPQAFAKKISVSAILSYCVNSRSALSGLSKDNPNA
jgi:hypothetical protein